MNRRQIGKALLFPHVAVLLLLSPAAIAFLIYTMCFLGTDTPLAITAYVLAAYVLAAWCFRIPRIVRACSAFGRHNTYIRRWREDAALRTKCSLYGTLFINAAYAALQLGMGLWHRSFWFCSLACYYLSLAVMRYLLLRHTGRTASGERRLEELRAYRVCGMIFLVMNVAVALMIFFMVYWNRSFYHHEITAIAIAAYTFTSLTLAIVNVVKYRRYNSPVYSASKAISLAAACVSMLILASTMLTTFGGETMDLTTRRLILGASGGGISAFLIAMAIYMIRQGTRAIGQFRAGKEN